MFIYIELSQIYKSIFKLTINYSNSHIVQDERKQISCESPLAWRRLDAAWMQPRPQGLLRTWRVKNEKTLAKAVLNSVVIGLYI